MKPSSSWEKQLGIRNEGEQIMSDRRRRRRRYIVSMPTAIVVVPLDPWTKPPDHLQVP